MFFRSYLFGNIFKKYISEISFDICLIGIVGASIANITKMVRHSGNM